MSRRTWLAVSMAAGIVSVLIAVSGGAAASVGGVRMSARSWEWPAVLSAITGTIWWWCAGRARAVGADLARFDSGIDAHGRGVALGGSLVVVLVALWFGTYSASGADASGYLSQAKMWASGAWRVADPLAALQGWPLEPGDTAPLGWRPALAPGWQVPTYAPGLPLLMAMPHAMAGVPGAMALVALMAGLTVLAAGALAHRLGGGRAALVSVVLLATSPTFLYQGFQPMSDVPVTAAWTMTWWLVVRGAPASAGVAAAVAVLIRPNLAPLAAIPWVVVITGASGGRVRQALRFAIPVALAGCLLAGLQWTWYGSPLRSGYGSAAELFALGNLAPNATLYATWAWEAETPAIITIALGGALTVAGALAGRRSGVRTASATAPTVPLVLFAGGVLLAYLVYAVFEVWSYLRFLLPAMVVLVVLAGVAVARALPRVTPPWRTVVLVLSAALIGTANLRTARELGVFRVAQVQARAREVGETLARMLPPGAVLLAAEQSGSMRYATGCPIVRWDGLTSTSLDRTLRELDARGYEVWWVLDQFEESLVRGRFAGVPEAMLDWPPRAEGGPLMRTRAWRLRDRP